MVIGKILGRIKKKVVTFKKVWTTFGFFQTFLVVLQQFMGSKSTENQEVDFNFQIINADAFKSDNFMKLDFLPFPLEKNEVQDYCLLRDTLTIKSRYFFDQNYDLGFGLGLLIYSSIRILKPKYILETGVAAGISSTFILDSLEKNGEGHLISIDITSKVGELVPVELRSRWILKKLKRFLPKRSFRRIIDSFEIDMFLHDSNHSPAWQLFELKTVVPKMKKRALVFIDDVSSQLLDKFFYEFHDFKVLVIKEETKNSAFLWRG